ncbi:hypothetical protein BX666DRAFT_2025001 [Dichotomocladium elegans]|nr:hypothetical protein BX666DRAFT_2025001 [Dichotomocladium elegans]
MAGYMAYSICLEIPDDLIGANDPSTIATMRDRFTARHPQLQNALFSTIRLSSKTMLNVVVDGPLTAVQTARSDLLRQSPIEYQTRLAIKSFNPDCIYAPGKRQALVAGLDEIATSTRCHIIIQEAPEPDLILCGSLDAVESARVRSLVLLDQLMGLHTETVQIPYYLHNLVAGRRHANIQSIMEETNTNVYLQSPFTKLGCTQHMATPVSERSGTIHLTGDSVGISRAHETLKKLASQKTKSLYHKQSTMHPRKLDWSIQHQQDQLRKIMKDNGSFVAFPALGSGSNTVTVYAENRINAERTLRSLNYLIYKIYEVSFCIKQQNDGFMRAEDFSQLFGSSEALTQLLHRISQASGAELSYRTETGRFEAFGTEKAVQTAYQFLAAIPVLKVHHSLSIFAVELASDQREFLSGKKNGKVNKIMKTCGVRIKFLAFNEYNFVITVESDDPDKAMEGVQMLQDELPAEMSFFVPEIYHRRIIGVAGKNIQRVMKRFGVYVKFSGAEEFASLGGYFENEHNVVARTPMKNHTNLENLKAAVMEFVTFEKDRDYITSTYRVPAYLHRDLVHVYGSEIREVCRAHNTKIWWPPRLGIEEISVVGPASQITSVLQFMNTIVLRESHLMIPVTDDLKHIISTSPSSNDLRELVQLIQNEYHINVIISQDFNTSRMSTAFVQWKLPSLIVTTPPSGDLGKTGPCVIRLRYFQEHEHVISDAKEKLCSYFKDHGVVCEFVNSVSGTGSKTLISPVSDDSCLNIDQEVLATISSPNEDGKKQEGGGYKLFDGSLSLSAFDGSSWSIFPADEKKGKLSESHLSLKDGPLRAIFENMPSSPPHPLDRRRASTAVLSTPMPGKNIWASPRLQASNSCSPRSLQGLMQDPASRRFHVPPVPYTSFSATTSTNRPNNSYHQSMPDLFFGRDIFQASGAVSGIPSPHHQHYSEHFTTATTATAAGVVTPSTCMSPPPAATDRMFTRWVASQQLPTPPPSLHHHHHHHQLQIHGKLDENTTTVTAAFHATSPPLDTKSAIPTPSQSSPYPRTQQQSVKPRPGGRTPGFNI